MRRRFAVLLCMCFGVWLPACQETTGPASDASAADEAEVKVVEEVETIEEIGPVPKVIPIIDTHTHINPANGSYKPALNYMLSEMEKEGVKTCLVMPPPQTGGNKKYGYQTGDWAALMVQNPGLVMVAGGGTLSPMIDKTFDEDGVYKKDKVDVQAFGKAAQAIADAGAAAFGEITALHLSFGDWHVFHQAHLDHPYFLKLAEVAKANDMPIDLHMEAVSGPASSADVCDVLGIEEGKNETHTPCDVGPNGCTCDFTVTVDPNNDYKPLSTLLAVGARVVWAHVGWDNTGEQTVELFDALLTKYGNLYLQLRPFPYTSHKESHPLKLASSNEGDWELKPKWVDLIQKFHTRFVIGSDHFFAVAGENANPLPNVWGYNRVLVSAIEKALGSDIAAEVAHKNAEAIYRGLK